MKLPEPVPGDGAVPAVAFRLQVPDGRVNTPVERAFTEILPAEPPPVAPAALRLVKAVTVMPPVPLLVMLIEPPEDP